MQKEKIDLRVSTQPDGTIINVQVINQPPNLSKHYLTAADIAQHAVRQASPLPIPKDKANLFRDFILTFDSR